MKTVFISYRRADSAGYTRSLYNSLVQAFSDQEIFMDVDDIEPGTDYVEVLESRLKDCVALLVMIGKQWLDIPDEQGQRRLDNPNDWVRIEIAKALERNVRVIPILIDGAIMPRETDLPNDLKPLARRQALTLSNDGFDSKMQRITKALTPLLKEQKTAKKYQHTNKNSWRNPSTKSENPRQKQAIGSKIKNFFMWIGIVVVSLVVLGIFLPDGESPDTNDTTTEISDVSGDDYVNESSSDSVPAVAYPLLAGVWYNDNSVLYSITQNGRQIQVSSMVDGLNVGTVEDNANNVHFDAGAVGVIQDDGIHLNITNPDGTQFILHRGHFAH